MATALVVVDAQKDFVTGSLAVPGAVDAVRRITDHIRENGSNYDVIVATADWHTDRTQGHFAAEGERPNFADTWPVHCMAGTDGAELHEDLDLPEGTLLFRKGQTEASYSGFDGHVPSAADGDDSETVSLADYLAEHEVDQVDIVGIALDYCVKATALDAAKLGFDTGVIVPMTAAVTPETGRAAIRKLDAAGVLVAGHLQPA